jgi:hypothetical protein
MEFAIAVIVLAVGIILERTRPAQVPVRTRDDHR